MIFLKRWTCLLLIFILLGGCDTADSVNAEPIAVFEVEVSALMLASGISPTSQPVTAEVWVTHLAPDRWRVDYAFDTPISGIVYGPPVASYRKRAWHVLTPGVELVIENGREAIVSPTRSFSSLSVEVYRFNDYAPDHYAPFVSFSDGGAALYLGFLTGEVIVDGMEYPVRFRFQFMGLPFEQVMPSHVFGERPDAYVYFGTREPVVAGRVRLLLDPATPAWLHDTFVRVTQSVTPLFSARFGFDLPVAPLVLIGADGLDRYEGYSVKGGAVGGQLVMLLRGRTLKQETEEVRAMLERLTAHELAHLWQLHSLPTGFNKGEPWIHEGGAEAMAVYALGESGLWSPAEVAAFAEGAAERCHALSGNSTLAEATRRGNWEAVYSCGFGLYWSAKADPISVWASLAEEAHRSDSVYTQATLDRVLGLLNVGRTRSGMNRRW